MAQFPDQRPRTRRNSDAGSQYSTQSDFSWKGLIRPQTRFLEDTMTTFLEDDTLNPLFALKTDDSSSGDDGEPSGMPVFERRWGYLSSPVPDVCGSSITTCTPRSSKLYYKMQSDQMYGLEEQDGVLYTRRHIAPARVNLPNNGPASYRCLFAFDSCNKLCTAGTWVSHVESHLSNVDPPIFCTCTICGDRVETPNPAITWNRFLVHVINHKDPRRFQPDKEFLEYCLINNIISEYTMHRADPSSRNTRRTRTRPQEPAVYKGCTPKIFMTGVSGVEMVDYPDFAAQPARGEQASECVVMVPARSQRIRHQRNNKS